MIHLHPGTLQSVLDEQQCHTLPSEVEKIPDIDDGIQLMLEMQSKSAPQEHAAKRQKTAEQPKVHSLSFAPRNHILLALVVVLNEVRDELRAIRREVGWIQMGKEAEIERRRREEVQAKAMKEDR